MANLTKGYGSISPELMTIERSDNEILYASINLNIECINGKYEWDEIVLPEYALNEIHKADKDIK
jgi:hypothetical protein